MAHSFTLGSIETKNKIASDAAFLVAIEVDVRGLNDTVPVETLFLVSNNEDRILNGITYAAYPFAVEFKYEAGSQGSVKVMAKDISRDLQARMQTYNGGVGFDVRLKIFHQNNLELPPEFEEQFRVIRASSADYVVTWELGAENLLDRQFPARRQFRDRCGWAYKGAECRYSGGIATCDYTLSGSNGCKAHNNAINFGGFPGLKSA